MLKKPVHDPFPFKSLFYLQSNPESKLKRLTFFSAIPYTIGFMHSCTSSRTSASSWFPVCHYWTNWLIQVCLTTVVTTTIIRHTWINQFVQ